MLLCDKLKERNLSFLGKQPLNLLIPFLKSVWSWHCSLLVSLVKEGLDMTDVVDLSSY